MANIPAELACPMCDVEVEMSRNQKVGDEIICPFCETPLKLRQYKENEDVYLQEDF